MPYEISVILPTHRVDKMLEDAIASVLESKGCTFELILVANGEAASQADLLQHKFATDKRVSVLKSFEPGIVAALNLGILKAQGPYIARMDGDDLIYPTRLADELTYIKGHPRCVAVATQVDYICKHGTVLGSSKYRRLVARGLKPLGSPVAHPTVMFRKLDWERVGGYSADYVHAEDLDLWNKFLNLGYIRVLSKPGLKYRLHDDQVSTKHTKAQVESSIRANLAAVSAQAESYFSEARKDGLNLEEILANLSGENFRSTLWARMRLRRVLGSYIVRTARMESKKMVIHKYFEFPLISMTYACSIVGTSLFRNAPNFARCGECLSAR